MGALDFWSYPSVEWRLAIVREWIEANGIATMGSNPMSNFAMPEDGRIVASLIAHAALLLIGLGSPAILLALVYLWRQRRINALRNTHSQLDAALRTNIFLGDGN